MIHFGTNAAVSYRVQQGIELGIKGRSRLGIHPRIEYRIEFGIELRARRGIGHEIPLTPPRGGEWFIPREPAGDSHCEKIFPGGGTVKHTQAGIDKFQI